MKLYSPWKRNNHFANLLHAEVCDKICSVEEFKNILLRERSRADREDKCFSLVVFDVKNTETNGGSHSKWLMVDTLTKRLRSADEAGWFDKEKIAVLLHNTLEEGARCFAKDFQKLIVNIGQPFSYTVCIYPDDWYNIDDGKGISGKCNPGDASSKKDSTISHNQILFTKQATREFISLASQPMDIMAENSNRSLHELMVSFLSKNPAWKRIIDVAGSTVIIIVISPLFFFVSLLIKIVSPGPVLFKQKRVGYMGKTFTLLKFRTMEVNIDATDHQQHVIKLIKGAAQGGEHSEKPMIKLDDHPHIIPFGKIIRKTCIDEMPQLINVLRGEMSLIGPRPPIPYEVEEYEHWHKRRLDVLPGLTGLWQVSGKNRLTFKEMVSLDIQYSKQLSFWLDIKIILKTPFAIVSQIKDYLMRKKLELIGVTRNA